MARARLYENTVVSFTNDAVCVAHLRRNIEAEEIKDLKRGIGKSKGIVLNKVQKTCLRLL